MRRITFKAATLPKTINFLPHIAINANIRTYGWSDWVFEIGGYVGMLVSE